MLDTLLHLPELIGRFVLIALVGIANLVILAIGGWVQLLMLLLPGMPAAPTVPVASWVGWLNWLFPIAPMVGALGVFVALWVTFLVVRIPLKWAKAL